MQRFSFVKRYFHGKSIVAGLVRDDVGDSDIFKAINPLTGAELPTPFYCASPIHVDDALRAAADASPAFSDLPAGSRSAFLRKAASEIEKIAEELVEVACAETGLPEPRIRNETARTVSQLRLFSDVVDAGHWLDARIDFSPGKPDTRRFGQCLHCFCVHATTSQ